MAIFDGDRPQVGNLSAPEPLTAPQFIEQPSAGAPRPPQDDQLGQLANALSSFNSSVGAFGRYYQIDQRAHPQQQERTDDTAFQQYKDTHTPQEVLSDAAAGNLPRFASPIVQRKIDMIHGTYAGQQLANDIQTKVGTGEIKWDDGSAQVYADQQRQAILQKNGWTPDSGEAAGFGAAFNLIQHNATQNAIRANVQNMQDDHSQAGSQAVEMATQAAFSGGPNGQPMDPAAAWAKITTTRADMVNHLHLTAAEIDPMVYQAIMRRAGKDPNWALAMLRQPRTDMDDGTTPVPPLADKKEYLDSVNRLQTQADAFNTKRADEAAQNSVNAQVQNMLVTQPQNIHNLPQQIDYADPAHNVSGSVKREQAVNDAANSIIQNDNKRVALGQATSQQVQDEQLGIFSQAGLRQHQWADTLNQAAKGGLDPQTLTDPTKQPQALAAYQLYSDLRTKNPAYLSTLMSPQAEKFFTTAYAQQTLFGRSPIEAMQASSQINATPQSEEERRALAAQHDLIDQQARAMDFGQGGWLGIGGTTIKNPFIAREALSQVAEGLVRQNGMAPQDAIRAAAPIVQNHFVNVNGSLVPDLHYLPKEMMKPAAENWLQSWATGPAKSLNLDPKSVTLAPAGTGRFMVVDGNSGMPIVAPHTNGGRGGFTYVTAPQLIQSAKGMFDAQRQAQQAASTAAAAQTANAIAKRNARAAAPPTPSVPFMAPGNLDLNPE